MIICLEGINGSGKTFLADVLMDRWMALGGRDARKLEPVQGTAFGRGIFAAIMSTTDLNPDAETLAFASARLHAASMVAPGANDLIVLERWAGAVVAYGTVSGTDPELLASLESILLSSMAINHTVVVDVSGQTATQRLSIQSGRNRFEMNGPDYLENVRRCYLDWARCHAPATIASGTMSCPEYVTWATDLINTLMDDQQNAVAS